MRQLASIREVNQHFSKFIHATEKGNEVIITRRGTPVACLIPFSTPWRKLDNKQDEARQRTLARMKKGYHLGGTRLTRDELHERR
ncbi:MAG TPA: type II toxin-antitoxin system prevent-host-death family antitoxin [Desulfobulbaceae bacterium]|nr:type II toxin-antitoxin system prevent-host-death family antitoxin [Desulfobulbaceae bacterium]